MDKTNSNFLKKLFLNLYRADTEDKADEIIKSLGTRFSWTPYGNEKGYFGVIENQQASAIPAIVEKITNSIDALLMRRCYENNIDPESDDAPKSVDSAIKLFFTNSDNWNLYSEKSKQAESIQILASGPRKNTSLVIYDDGEGQHPQDFPDTFLSLLKSNKNGIPFVQGKYNMGGSGAVVFCGKKRYQLIASRRYDKTGPLGFTLLRKHPFSTHEEETLKSTWYEYFLFDGKIPSFEINSLDLGLHKRHFETGSLIKLYSYDLPPGSRSVISRDLNQSINEYLFEPALPLYTIDTPKRYPHDYNLQRPLYGLKRRLEEEDNKYIKEKFSEKISIDNEGSIKINVYVFNPLLEGKTVKETKETIKNEFFKNNMSVMYSVNGQVHGHYTTEFITNTLKFNLLKGYLLIHVDCTELKTSFRNELFMASRDRIKQGENSSLLRNKIANNLKNGRLKNINKEWKDSVSISSENAENLLKNFSKNIPMNQDFRRLLGNTLSSEVKNKSKNGDPESNPKRRNTKEIQFNPQRYPSTFKIDLKSKKDSEIPVTSIPLDGERNLFFSTDVENEYFDRIEDPGELKIAILSSPKNEVHGGDKPGLPNNPDTLFNVSVSSPINGKIRVNLKPTKMVKTGDKINLKVSLSSPIEENLDQIFMVQISDKENKPKKIKEPTRKEERLGLPECIDIYYAKWEQLIQNGIDIDYKKVMIPIVDGNKLEKIYINMDSTVLKNYKSKLKTTEQIKLANNRFISAVYFHTLFLYSISKNNNYQFSKQDDVSIDLADYLMDIFDSSYSEFLLKFEIDSLIENLDE